MSDQPKTILVVEDEFYVQGMLEDFLRRQGHNVIVVPTAEGAFSTMKDKSVDLVLLDKNLPDMSGVEVLSEIRFTDPDLPVIFMTGYPSERSRLLVEHLGILAYFEKPVNLKELGSAIEEALFGPVRQDTAGPPAAQEAVHIVRFSGQDAAELPTFTDVVLCSTDERLLDLLAEAGAHIQSVVQCTSADEAFDYLQSHQTNVLALDLGLLGTNTLSVARWATTRDPALSILAIDSKGSQADAEQLLTGLNVRYILGPDDLTREACCAKLEVLVRRAKMLRSIQQGTA